MKKTIPYELWESTREELTQTTVCVDPTIVPFIK